MANPAPISLLFSLAISAGAVSLRIETGTDTVTTKVHQQDDKCACIPWKQAYSMPNVRCGVGMELAVYGSRFIKTELIDNVPNWDAEKYETTCTNFFEKLPGAYCLTDVWGNASTTRIPWCYVSPECKSALLIMPSGAPGLNVKGCDAMQGDNVTNYVTPLRLNKIAESSNISLNLLARLSYPTSEYSWAQVESEAGLSEMSRVAFHAALYAKGQPPPSMMNASAAAVKEWNDTMASHLPRIFNEDEEGLHPGTVVWGETLYASMPNITRYDPLVYKCQVKCEGAAGTA